MVRAVEGVQPGLYHYALEAHELELIEAHTVEEATELILEFTAGQGTSGSTPRMQRPTASCCWTLPT